MSDVIKLAGRPIQFERRSPRRVPSLRRLWNAGYAAAKAIEVQLDYWRCIEVAAVFAHNRTTECRAKQRDELSTVFSYWKQRFLRWHRILHQNFKWVAPWWIATRAPDFEPRATSAVEGVLWRTSQLEKYIDVGGDPFSTSLFAWLHCPDLRESERAILSGVRLETVEILTKAKAGELMYCPGANIEADRVIGAECEQEVCDRLPPNWDVLDSSDRIQTLLARVRGEAPRDQASPSVPCVQLSSQEGNVCSAMVLDKRKVLPSAEIADVLRCMLEAFPSGCNLEQIQDHHTNGQKALSKLVKNDFDWERAVHLPGKRGRGGYRIRSVEEARNYQRPLAQSELSCRDTASEPQGDQ